MEHVPDPHGARGRAVAALARAWVARRAGERLRERVRAALARWAAIGADLRAAYVRALTRIGERMRLNRAWAARVRVAWADPVTPTAADRVRVPRLCDPADHWARGGPPVYPDGPGPIPALSDVIGPEGSRRPMSSNLVYMDESHHFTAPTLNAEQLARVDRDIQATLRRISEGHQ